MRILLIIILLTACTFSQTFEFSKSLSEFKGASSFFINPAGIIYITDAVNDEVYVIDTLGVPIHSIGGYGWRESAFDNPVDVFADALKVFITDKNNHRIQRFDKNLNYNFQISTRESTIEEERFGYPLSAVMSNQGDVFILDSENSRIVKFDIFGNFIQNFGSYDYGSYSLTNPKQLAISMQNNIFVIDENEILIFDQFGNGIGFAEGKENFTGIKIIFNELVVNTDEKVFHANLRYSGLNLTEINLIGFENDVKIISSFIFNNKFYLLTKRNILVFNKSEL
jgi:hypothetical protein